MTRVSIIGSCVSRDIFNFAEPGEFQLVNYIARSSIGSLFSPPPFADIFSERLASNFQQRIVGMDITKSGRKRLQSITADLVLIDLIDERFNLAAVSNGAVCTISNEFIKTGALKELQESKKIRIIRSGSEPFMQTWTRGWRALVELLRITGMLERTYVNRVYWQSRTQSGKAFPNVTQEQIEAANLTLERLYGIMADTLPASRFIDYHDEVCHCPDEHPWGPAPFHFVESFYHAAIDKLRQLGS